MRLLLYLLCAAALAAVVVLALCLLLRLQLRLLAPAVSQGCCAVHAIDAHLLLRALGNDYWASRDI